PVLEAVEPGGLPKLAEIVTAILFFAMLLSAVNAASERGIVIVIMLLLVGLLVALWVVNQFVDSEWIAVVAEADSAILLGFTITVLFRHLFASDRVTWNTIAASLCIYLLMIVPAAFKLPAEYISVGAYKNFAGQGSAIALYYSLVTMTTLGYGDIVPVAPPARTLAGMQAVTGQLYIAVLVARLVGLHIAQSTRVS
ncbi:MAG: potassium channel family protein, partial [Planctomycetota bacterium]